MDADELDDGLPPPVAEEIIDDDGVCRTTVYRYSQEVTEARKALILSFYPDARFVTRMRVGVAHPGVNEMYHREIFTEVLVPLVAQVVVSARQ